MTSSRWESLRIFQQEWINPCNWSKERGSATPSRTQNPALTQLSGSSLAHSKFTVSKYSLEVLSNISLYSSDFAKVMQNKGKNCSCRNELAYNARSQISPFFLVITPDFLIGNSWKLVWKAKLNIIEENEQQVLPYCLTIFHLMKVNCRERADRFAGEAGNALGKMWYANLSPCFFLQTKWVAGRSKSNAHHKSKLKVESITFLTFQTENILSFFFFFLQRNKAYQYQ